MRAPFVECVLCAVVIMGLVGCNSDGDGTSNTNERADIDVCALPAVAGPCEALIPSWFHNAGTGVCEAFDYGGCNGNGNRFSTLEECESACVTEGDICMLPAVAGPCEALIPSWFHNADTGACEAFDYGGCDGNGNRFSTLEECEFACVGVDICTLPAVAGPCEALIPSWFHNADTGVCEAFNYGGCNGNGNRFASLEECESACVTEGDICMLPAVAGPCEALIPSWFHNADTGACEAFNYGGCDGNGNRFSTLEECEFACVGIDICTLPAVAGPCEALIPSWFYNVDTGVCESFNYGGCNGNGNRFSSLEECISGCIL